MRRWLSTLPAVLILLLTVLQGTSEALHGRMLAWGDQIWPNYVDLRIDEPAPSCDPAAFDAPAVTNDDDDLLDALFEEADEDEAPSDDVDLDALFEEAAQDEAPSDEVDLDALFEEAAQDEAPSDEVDLDALFEEAAEDEAPSDEVDLDALFAEAGTATAPDEQADAAAAARAAARAQCEAEHAQWTERAEKKTSGLMAYAAVEDTLASWTATGRSHAKFILILLIVLCAATATTFREHIAFRPLKTHFGSRIADAGQLVANGLLVTSCLANIDVLQGDGATGEALWIPWLWVSGVGLMALINLIRLAKPPTDLQPDGGSISEGLLGTPLYVGITIISATWFLLDDHPSGMAIYLDKLAEHASLYIQVGLYVWAGMLLKQTQLAERSMDVLRPWGFPPELLAAVLVVVAAVPTAYSGASGIFVIAAGALIYDELRRAGARNQLALASTAMSGSLGVVLSPCLLVVIVASLNKQVTTTELFQAGGMVFLISAGLFVALVLATRQNPLSWNSRAQAWPGMRDALRQLAPYVGFGIAILALYGGVLDTWLDEHSAPKILPVLLFAMVAWEALRGGEPLPHRVEEATTETTGHIGALLTLMGISVCFGGVIERAEVMAMMPADLGSTWMTMLVLTVMLVIIGMLLDPYGAVILVSATLSDVAMANNISPLHFWMVVLVAFELGYLTPPVALNHLLTRAVVGDGADDDDLPPDASFWYRNERLVLPVTVMGTTLLIVATGPLLLQELGF